MPESRSGATSFDWNSNIPGYRAPDSTAIRTTVVSLLNVELNFQWDVDVYLPAGVGDLATGLTDCRKRSQRVNSSKIDQFRRRELIVDGFLTVQTDNFSHCGGCFQAKKSGEGESKPKQQTRRSKVLRGQSRCPRTTEGGGGGSVST